MRQKLVEEANKNHLPLDLPFSDLLILVLSIREIDIVYKI